MLAFDYNKQNPTLYDIYLGISNNQWLSVPLTELETFSNVGHHIILAF